MQAVRRRVGLKDLKSHKVQSSYVALGSGLNFWGLGGFRTSG